MNKVFLLVVLALLSSLVSAEAGFNADTGEVSAGGTVPSDFSGTLDHQGDFTLNGQHFVVSPETNVEVENGQIKSFDGELKESVSINGVQAQGTLGFADGKFFVTTGTLLGVPMSHAVGITVSEKIMEGTAGEACSVDGVNFAKDSKFKYDTSSKEMTLNKNAKVEQVDPSFQGTINMENNEIKTGSDQINEKDIPRYEKMTGKLHFENGQMFVQPNEGPLKIGNIGTLTVNQKTNLNFNTNTYLDGYPKSGGEVAENSFNVYKGNMVTARFDGSLTLPQLEVNGKPETMSFSNNGAAIVDVPLDLKGKIYKEGEYYAGNEAQVVKQIQEKLNAKIQLINQRGQFSYAENTYDEVRAGNIPVDGLYGPKTKQAVEVVQQYYIDHHQLSGNSPQGVDGKYGFNTATRTSEVIALSGDISFKESGITIHDGKSFEGVKGNTKNPTDDVSYGVLLASDQERRVLATGNGNFYQDTEEQTRVSIQKMTAWEQKTSDAPTQQDLDGVVALSKYYNGPSSRYAGLLTNNDDVTIHKQADHKIEEVDGLASIYSSKDSDSGRITATGAPVTDDTLRVAVTEKLGYRLPARVRITNLNTGKEVEAIADDHGPYKIDSSGNALRLNGRPIPSDSRIVDVNPEVARRLGFTQQQGITRVKVELIEESDLKKG